MMIPLLAETVAVLVGEVQKQEMQEPEMFWLTRIEAVTPFKASEEGSPPESKLGADFDPHAFYASVARRTEPI